MNISTLLDMAADGFGDRVVLGRRNTGCTAARLRAWAVGGAEVIRRSGADAVVYLAVNGPAFPVALLAAARAGVPFVPLNYRLGQEQLDGVLAEHTNALGIADPAHRATLARQGLVVHSTDEWLATAERVSGDDTPTESDRPAAIIYTSGSTSAPKGVRLSHDNLVSYVLGTVEFMGASEEEAALVSVPPYHIAGVANVLTNLYAGRRVLAMEAFSPHDWLGTVRSEHITHALVVPTMLTRIMDSGAEDLEVPTLRTLAYGGAPMPSAVIERALRAWPHVDFVNAYGLTETSSTIALLGPDDHRAALRSPDPDVRKRLMSVGHVVPGVELEIRDASGQVVPAGTSGGIWVRGQQVSGQYTGTGPVLDERGFFDTRDEGSLDRDGYLFLAGRTDDTIIRGAENIAPAEIEDVLLRHPDVVDAVVVGVPDQQWGQRIEAAVVPREGAVRDTESLRTYVRDRLRGSKTPDRIVYWSELPRTETGKLIRRQVVSRIISPTTASFRGADGLKLTADVWGPEEGASVLMLHGGGQTRHSWKATSTIIAGVGLRVVALDLRGHGDSDWSSTGEYGLDNHCEDVLEVLEQISTPTTIIGASLGGLTGLLVTQAAAGRVSRLALVDVVPRYEKTGSGRIRDFMQGAPHGFASLDEAADAIAAYLPHRTRPSSTEGLRRNLRLREDGRWYWHWDPKMMAGPPKDTPEERAAQFESAARSLNIPVLLIQGQLSDVVSDEGVEEFRSQVPHLEVIRLPAAAHTAAGDDNNAFTAAVVDFCTRR